MSGAIRARFKQRSPSWAVPSSFPNEEALEAIYSKGVGWFDVSDLISGAQLIPNRLNRAEYATLGSSAPGAAVFNGGLLAVATGDGYGWKSAADIASPPGNFTIEFGATISDLTPASHAGIGSQSNTSASDRSWRLAINPSGYLVLEVGLDGSSGGLSQLDSDALSGQMSDGDTRTFRVAVVFDGVNVSATWEISDNHGQTWTEIGTPSAAFAATRCHASTQPVFLNARYATAGSGMSSMSAGSSLHWIRMRDASGQVLWAQDFRDVTEGATSTDDNAWGFTSSTMGVDSNDPTLRVDLGEKALVLPGVSGDYAQMTGAVYDATAENIEIAGRAYFYGVPTTTNGAVLGGFTNSARLYFHYNDSGKLTIRGLNDAALVIGNYQVDPPAGGILNRWVWLKARLTRSTGLCEYWYSFQDVTDEADVTWKSLGSGTGSNPNTDLRTPAAERTIGSNSTGGPDRDALAIAAIRLTVDADEVSANFADTTQTDQSLPAGLTINRNQTSSKSILLEKGQTTAQGDGSDDYIGLPTSCRPSITAAAGGFGVAAAIRLYNEPNSYGQIFSTDDNSSGTALRFNLNTFETQVIVRGGSSTAFHTYTGATVGTSDVEVVGAQWDAGSVAGYIHGDGLSSSPTSYASVGTLTFSGPRLLSRTDSAALLLDADFHSIVVFGEAPTEDELDAVSTYLKALA